MKLVFLPPNITVKTQPMDAGVMWCLCFYHGKNMAEMRLLDFEDQSEFKVDLLYALIILKKLGIQCLMKLFKTVLRKPIHGAG